MFQGRFKNVLYNFVFARKSPQLPEQKEGLFEHANNIGKAKLSETCQRTCTRSFILIERSFCVQTGEFSSCAAIIFLPLSKRCINHLTELFFILLRTFKLFQLSRGYKIR